MNNTPSVVSTEAVVLDVAGGQVEEGVWYWARTKNAPWLSGAGKFILHPNGIRFYINGVPYFAADFEYMRAAMPVWPDQCEHGVIEGEWCEPCNKAYKEARIENGLTD